MKDKSKKSKSSVQWAIVLATEPPERLLPSPDRQPPLSMSQSLHHLRRKASTSSHSSSVASRVSGTCSGVHSVAPTDPIAPIHSHPKEVPEHPELPVDTQHQPLYHLSGQQLISFDQAQLAYLYGMSMPTQEPA